MATEGVQTFPIIREETIELDKKESLSQLIDFGMNILRAKRRMASEKDKVDPKFFKIATQEIQDTIDHIIYDIVTTAISGNPLPFSSFQSYDIFEEN